jgi:hypothetical protein
MLLEQKASYAVLKKLENFVRIRFNTIGLKITKFYDVEFSSLRLSATWENQKFPSASTLFKYFEMRVIGIKVLRFSYVRKLSQVFHILLNNTCVRRASCGLLIICRKGPVPRTCAKI